MGTSKEVFIIHVSTFRKNDPRYFTSDRALELDGIRNGGAGWWIRGYGDTEDPRRLVGAIARALVRGEPVDCSRGLAVRDYVDVADAGAALSTLVLSDAEGPFNIGSGHGVRVADLATALGRLAGRPDLIRLGALPDRPGEPPRIVADTTRLRQAIGGAPASISDNRLTALLRSWAVREAPSIVD